MTEHWQMLAVTFAASFSGNVAGRVAYHLAVAAWQRRQVARTIATLTDSHPRHNHEQE